MCYLHPYQPGYTAPPPPPPSDDTTIDISGGWTLTGAPLDLNDPRVLAMAAAERHFLEAEYDEYAATNASGAVFCRSAALILMALLLLRHALSITNAADDDDDASTFFSGSFCHATLWPGRLVFCSVEDKDRNLRHNDLNGTLDIGIDYSKQLQVIDLQNNLITEFKEKGDDPNGLMYLYADLYAHDLWAGDESPKNSGNFTSTRIPFNCVVDSPIKCDSMLGSPLPSLGYIYSFGEDNRKDIFFLASSGVYKNN